LEKLEGSEKRHSQGVVENDSELSAMPMHVSTTTTVLASAFQSLTNSDVGRVDNEGRMDGWIGRSTVVGYMSSLAASLRKPAETTQLRQNHDTSTLASSANATE
jgi:hypothetical protein